MEVRLVRTFISSAENGDVLRPWSASLRWELSHLERRMLNWTRGLWTPRGSSSTCSPALLPRGAGSAPTNPFQQLPADVSNAQE